MYFSIIGGSLVDDYIMVFPGNFREHIDPDSSHEISLSFSVKSLELRRGGTAGNIGYNMRLLNFFGLEPLIVSALGVNGSAYLKFLKKHGIRIKYIHRDPKLMNATCYLSTDLANSQINNFYDGPTNKASRFKIKDIVADVVNNMKGKVGMAIISPSSRDLMLTQIKECADLGIDTIFDPGQQNSSFSGDELRSAIELCKFMFVNDSELKQIERRSALTEADILQKKKTIVTTYGKNGSAIEDDLIGRIAVPACENIVVEDPTGAGDALRAGFMAAYQTGCDYITCLEVGNTAASFAVEHLGPQEHYYTKEAFMERFESNYGSFPKIRNIKS